MAFKGIILFCFLLTLHKSYLELPRRGTEPVEQQPTEGLGLGSVIRSLRRSGFMGLNLITRPKRQPTKGNNALYLALLLLCAGDIETNPGPTNIVTCSGMLFLLYITLDGCGWSSLASPMIFSRQLNINGSLTTNSEGDNSDPTGGGLNESELLGAILGPIATVVAALITAITGGICTMIVKRHCREARSKSTPDHHELESSNRNPAVDYARYLKAFYKDQSAKNRNVAEDQWPPPVANIHKFIRLAMVMADETLQQGIPDDSPKRKTGIDERVTEQLQQKGIELKNILKVGDQTITKVLVEGAPGSGKSTLSLHMCHQWAIGELFQDFKLVILVRLRDPKVHNAKNITDLLPKKDWNKATVTANWIKENAGEGVLWVLDGWDELPNQYQPWFLGLVKGPELVGSSFVITSRQVSSSSELAGSSFVITSRPVSSTSLQRLVSSRIVILGFDQKHLKEYFKSVLNDGNRADDLIEKISRNPRIEGTCYLPLNASIIVHLCKHNSEYALPDSQYEIFTKLVSNCITRHHRKIGPSNNFACNCMKSNHETNPITSLDELSTKDKRAFERLCKIAYTGIMKDPMEVVFELDSRVNTLGLLETVESLVDNKPSLSYNFLHLSIQELLAAIHMAKLPIREQTEQFTTLFGKETRFAAVFQFFAAKTKLEDPELATVVEQVAESSNKALLLSLIHCLFEANDSDLYRAVVQTLALQLDLSDTRLNPADCYSLGCFLTHCKDFEVDLNGCYIGDGGCKALFGQQRDYSGIRILYLENNDIKDEGAEALSKCLKKMANLQQLDLQVNAITEKGAKKLLKQCPGSLRVLALRFNAIDDDDGQALDKAAEGKDIDLLSYNQW